MSDCLATTHTPWSVGFWKVLIDLRSNKKPDLDLATSLNDPTFLDAVARYANQALYLLMTLECAPMEMLKTILLAAARKSGHVALQIALLTDAILAMHKDSPAPGIESFLSDLRSLFSVGFYQHHHIFLTSIVNISKSLATVQDRKARTTDMLHMLRGMNSIFSQEMCYVCCGNNTAPVRRVLRFSPNDCAVFSTRERAPYMLVMEVQVSPEVRNENIGDVEFQQFCSPPCSPPAAIYRPSPTTPTTPEQAALTASVDNQPPDTLTLCYGKPWSVVKESIRQASPLGDMEGWDVDAYIVKYGDNLIQEAFAMQLIRTISDVWKEAQLPLHLTTYEVLVTNSEAGLIECITDAKTIDSIKKYYTPGTTLMQHFIKVYGDPTSLRFREAQRRFVESSAAYSVVCYLLQIRDRHNGNILLRRDGTVVHIDFGFLLTTSPGGWNFENVPFKLVEEYVEVMGNDGFAFFKLLVYMGLHALRRHSARIVSLVEMADVRCMPCLGVDTRSAVQGLRDRFMVSVTEAEFMRKVKDMINLSLDNWRTRSYDRFQAFQNGIQT
eukprot:PhF_6_TR29249/c0_g1_i1/m.42812/K19801/PI4KB; phosphatidylinositol 4-kinase B